MLFLCKLLTEAQGTSTWNFDRSWGKPIVRAQVKLLTDMYKSCVLFTTDARERVLLDIINTSMSLLYLTLYYIWLLNLSVKYLVQQKVDPSLHRHDIKFQIFFRNLRFASLYLSYTSASIAAIMIASNASVLTCLWTLQLNFKENSILSLLRAQFSTEISPSPLAFAKNATNRRDKTTAQKSCNICTYKC